MGLFSFLKPKGSNSPETAPVSESKPFESKGVNTIPTLNPDMPITVFHPDNLFDAMMSGRLGETSPGKLCIECTLRGRSFQVLDEGMAVVVHGYDKDTSPMVIDATVVHSNSVELVVGDCSVKSLKDNRRVPRLPIDMPGSVYLPNDKNRSKPIDCRVVDISTSGACIISEFAFCVGDMVRLHAELIKGSGAVTYPCEVMRITPLPDGIHSAVGLLFHKFDGWKVKELQLDLEAIREDIAKKLH